MDRRKVGVFGEQVAATWLQQNGYNIIRHNYRCRMGEIDLIAGRGDTLVFVEVKTRQGDAFGHPAEAVDREKLRHMHRAATVYMQERRIHNAQIRFDVLSLSIEHLKGVGEC